MRTVFSKLLTLGFIALSRCTGLQGQHQIQNATLAVHLARHYLNAQLPNFTPHPPEILSSAFIAGLEKTRWPGRCQIVVDPSRPGKEDGNGSTTWFLDGAHTVESLKASAEWYFSPGVGLSANNGKAR